MATATERTNIIKLVTAMFNAAPGATYLAEFTAFFDAAGGTSAEKLASLATALSNTTSYKALNPATQTAAEFASVFLTPFGLQANQEAIDFITSRFNMGLNKGQIAYEATLALTNSTAPVFATARAILDNKTNVAEYFSVTKAIAQTDVSQLTSVLANVTSDPATVQPAKTAIDGGAGASTNTTFTLTAGVDTITASSIGDTINGTEANLGAQDTVNGGAGADTFNLTTSTFLTTIPGAQLSNVETLNITAGTNANITNVTGVTGLTTIGNINSTTALTVNSVAAVGAVNVTTAGSGTTIVYTEAAVAGTADTVTLNVNGTNGVVNLNSTTADTVGIETINLVGLVADGNLTLNSNDSSVITLNISGAFGETIALGTNLVASVKTINASTATGGVSVSAALNTTGVTISGGMVVDTLSGGSGIDSITGGLGADTLAGGLGADTFVTAQTGSNTTTGVDTISDFAGGTDVLDLAISATGTVNTASTGADVFNNSTALASTGVTAATLMTDLQTAATALAVNGFAQAGDTFSVQLTGASLRGTGAFYVVQNSAADTTVTAADTIIALIGTSTSAITVATII